MQIYFLRHGESEANVAGVISDDPAKVYHLTPMGIAQAEVAAEELMDIPFTHVYVSQHQRTRETAEILIQAWLKEASKDQSNTQAKKNDGKHETKQEDPEAQTVPLAPEDKFPITEDARLNERKSGMDGEPVTAFNALVKPDPVHIKPEGGESFLEQMERLKAFLDEVAERHVDGTILAVSHENPILAAQAAAGRSPEDSAKANMANCAWVKIEWPPKAKEQKNGNGTTTKETAGTTE